MNASYFNYSFEISAKVDTGLERPSNQDEILLSPDIGFFAVLDGMGGLPGGGIASNMAKHNLPVMIQEVLSETGENLTTNIAEEILKEQVTLLSNSIYQSSNKDYYTSGTTISGVWLVEEYAIFTSLGDSRGYLLPKGEKDIEQITRDHNRAAEFVEEGWLTKEAAVHHWSSCELTAFIAHKPPVEPDIFIRKLQPGDKILLCSDGLYGMVNEKYLSALLDMPKPIEKICNQMVKKANTNGGHDNISVICIEIL